MALPIEDPEELAFLARIADWMLLLLGLDKAAVNFLISVWMVDQALASGLENFLVHIEPCGAHALALAKKRSNHGAKAAAALNSFSRLSRVDSVGNALVEEPMFVLQESVRVKTQQRPQIFKQRAAWIMEQIFPPESRHTFQRTTKTGEIVFSQWYLDVQALFEVVDIGSDDPDDEWVHWCYVEAALLRSIQTFQNKHRFYNVQNLCMENRLDFRTSLGFSKFS